MCVVNKLPIRQVLVLDKEDGETWSDSEIQNLKKLGVVLERNPCKPSRLLITYIPPDILPGRNSTNGNITFHEVNRDYCWS
jgi:hypothetical protein